MEAAPDASKRRRRRKRGKKGESIQQTAVGTKAPPVLGASAAGEAQERRPVKRGRPAAAPGGAAVAMAGQSGGTAKRPRQGLSDLQQKFMAKLEGAQFRRLNELLYTRHGDEAFSHFQAAPSDFDVVSKWPVNPLDVVIEHIRRMPSAVVGDFGCGEARLAASVPNRVHSFDLVAANERVTACNMTEVPLADGSLDVAVFCLSLMGTDYVDFLAEAYRVLKPSGKLLVAEVRSRFAAEGELGGAAAQAKAGASAAEREARGQDAFVRQLRQLGFRLANKDARNTMFVLFDFVRDGKERPDAERARRVAALKPCVYKRR